MLLSRAVIISNMKEKIECHGFTLREWSLDDIPSVARYANNLNIAMNLRDGFPHPYTLADAESFIRQAISEDSSKLLYAIEVDDHAVGSIGAIFGSDVYRINAEIGYWLAEEYWGRGIITTAVECLAAYIFSNYEGIERLFAEPFADNHASARVLEKAGFRLEATFKNNVIKMDKIKDSHIYAILRSDYKKNHNLG